MDRRSNIIWYEIDKIQIQNKLVFECKIFFIDNFKSISKQNNFILLHDYDKEVGRMNIAL